MSVHNEKKNWNRQINLFSRQEKKNIRFISNEEFDLRCDTRMNSKSEKFISGMIVQKNRKIFKILFSSDQSS